MQAPLEITYDGIPRSQWVDDYIHEQARRLDHICDDLMSCQVVVARLQHHRHTGNPFRVRVRATIPPKKGLIGDKRGQVVDPQVQLRPIIRKAFEAVEKQLHKQMALRRGEIKHHEEPHALVVRLFSEQGYGFIKSPSDGQEYFFHRNAVLHGDFERLEPGTEVRFEPEMGEEGPQASTVQIVSKLGARIGRDEEKTSKPAAGWENT